MSSRPQMAPFVVIKDGDMSLTSLTSKVTVITKLSMISYQCVWVGTTPVGTVTVQVSNNYSQDPSGNVSNPGDWDTLPLSSATNISGNSDSGFIDIEANAGHAFRLIYTKISGTGVLNVTVSGKVA